MNSPVIEMLQSEMLKLIDEAANQIPISDEEYTDVYKGVTSILTIFSLAYKKSVCQEEGHVWPKVSPDYYFCERCGEYLG